MARISRTRSYTTSRSGKKWFYVKGVLQSGYPMNLTLSNTSSMTDSHGRPVTPSSLASTTWKGEGLQWDGQTDWYLGSDQWRFKWDHYPHAEEYGGLDVSPTPAPSGWMLSLVAGTNPSRPMLAPPTLIQDFISIPAMIRDLGKLFGQPKKILSPQEAANQYLLAQFGYLPLIKDLMDLLDLQRHVLKRTAELQKLYSKGGLRRRIRFSEDTKVSSYAALSQAGFSARYVRCNVTVKCTKRVWGTIRWTPTTLPPYHPNDVRMNRLATRLVLGLTAEGMAKGLWDVIPWTWLLGWFTNVGKYLWAYSYTVPAQHSAGCLMRESITTWSCGATTYDAGISGNAELTGHRQRKQMTREVSYVALPGFNMPFVDMFRLSIIGALFTQRFVKR